jgi:hypothetical protein
MITQKIGAPHGFDAVFSAPPMCIPEMLGPILTQSKAHFTDGDTDHYTPQQ